MTPTNGIIVTSPNVIVTEGADFESRTCDACGEDGRIEVKFRYVDRTAALCESCVSVIGQFVAKRTVASVAAVNRKSA